MDESNNGIILVGDGHRHDITLPRDCYELKEIVTKIQKLINWTSENTKVTITENNISLCASLLIKDKNWYVEFPKENSLDTILGFESKEYHYQVDQFGKPASYVSEKIVNILSVNSILVHCEENSHYNDRDIEFLIILSFILRSGGKSQDKQPPQFWGDFVSFTEFCIPRPGQAKRNWQAKEGQKSLR